MSNRSRSKENFSSSYFDMTSPLSNLQRAKYKNSLKNSIHNSFMDKLQMYKDETKNTNETLIKSHVSLTSLKASSVLYKLPEFSAPQVNYQISQAIKQKANQIKEEMVNNLPNLLSSSTLLPSIGSKSSNYNPKKIQNLLGHRSTILELQTWLKNSLLKNPPTSPDQLIEYKQMIMGVGMKELIRLINSRCLQEGKLVEQVWQLTWGICKEIIMHMALRAKKCQQILSQEISDYNMGCKRSFQEKDKELSELRKKVQDLYAKNNQMAEQIEELTMQNEKLTIENNRNFQQSNYVNEEFLKVLEENLAMYLHLGDNKKKDWIKKMYKQVNKAKGAVKDNLKLKVNKTVQKRIQQENIFSDQQIEPNELEVDPNGNYVVFSQNKQQNQEENVQNGQNIDHNDQVPGEQMCINLKDQLQKEFSMIEAETQTEKAQTLDEQTQSEIKTFEDKETGEEPVQFIQLGINTEQEQSKDQEKGEKGKSQKNKNQKKISAKGPNKQKLTKKVSDVGETIEAKQTQITPSEEEEKLLAAEEQKKYKIEIIDYVCKQCFIRKSKEEALKEISFEGDLQKLKLEIIRLKEIIDQQSLNELEQLKQTNKSIDQTVTKNLSDNKNINDVSERLNQKQLSNNQKNSPFKKTQEAKNNAKAKISVLKEDLNRSIKNINKIKEEKKTSPRSVERYDKDTNKKELQSIEERMVMEEVDQGVQLKRIKKQIKRRNFQIQENSTQIKSESPQLNSRQGSPASKGMDSISVRSGSGKKEIIENKQKRSSSIIHDISIKKEIELTSQSKDTVHNIQKEEEGDNDHSSVVAKLPISQKEPYFRFFTEQITEANRDVIDQISSQQATNELTLNNYFNIVQEVNSIPESKIHLSDKQMLTIIQKNLMPIILELLNTVKKTVFKKSVDQSIKTFYSLPFILMNKFSTKYGVKILAIKNMKLLLSSLKKIELVTDRYKSLRLMLFTDCRAIFSEDLFVYLLVLAVISPQLDLERPIKLEQSTQIRQICERYLTQEKKVYQQFETMTKQAFSLSSNQDKFNTLKLAPLLRSIITSYRMVKINRIEEIGFVFLMLKKENYLEYLTFSYFMSCFKLQTDLKVKIVKTFLGNCDLKTKSKRVAMSQSGFSRFLIHCPEFNFQFLNSVILKQSNQINGKPSISSTKKTIQINKSVSEQFGFHKFNPNEALQTHAYSKNEDHLEESHDNPSQKRLKTEKQILLQSQKILNEPKQLVEGEKLSEWSGLEQMDLDESREKVEVLMVKKEKRHLSLNYASITSSVTEKTKNYSYFTYEISRFLENEEETKYMTSTQKEFVINYLTVHIMACEVEQMIGLIDYFSSDMLEIICCDESELRIQEGEIME